MSITIAKPNSDKVYRYETIRGIPVTEYKRQKARGYYTPRKMAPKYSRLPDEAKELIFRMHDLQIGLEKICKLVNTDPRFENLYIGKRTVSALLKDANQRKQFSRHETW